MASNSAHDPSPIAKRVRSPELGPYAGQTLSDRYRLIRLLGKGGMGSVYLGRHVLVGKPVAVKILDSGCFSDGQGFKRLFREAQSAASIGHPNIIDVHDVGLTPTGDPFLVMEYLEGEDLATLLERHAPLSVAAACGVVEPVLSALNAAHAKGIIHRDLKPANIYLIGRDDAPPMVKLIDFGVSKYVGGSEHAKITLPGTVLGTPAYMSPEQARGGDDVDERADIYAIGVVLFQMLTNRLPFEGSNYNDLIFKIVHDEPQLTESTLQLLPVDARVVIDRAMSKNVDDRYPSAAELLEALRGLRGWDERAVALSELAGKIHIHAFGGGDLGMMSHRSGGSHFDVYEFIRRDAAAAELAQTKAESEQRNLTTAPDPPLTDTLQSGSVAKPVRSSGPTATLQSGASTLQSGSSPGPAASVSAVLRSDASLKPASSARSAPPKRNFAFPITVVASLTAVTLSLIWWTGRDRGVEPSASAHAASITSPASTGVQVTLRGVPADAKVFYDMAPVSMNPFRVERRDTIVPIRVEAAGYAPFVDTIVPSKDVVVEVELQPLDAGPATSGSGEHQPPSVGGGHKSTPAIGKGARDTYYTEKFE